MAVNPSPLFSELLKNPVHLLAFGFGSGLSPKAPGTAGTVAAIPFYLLWVHVLPNIYAYAAMLLVATLVGFYLCGKTAKDLGVHDHGGIVWDEFVGFWLTMMFAPAGWFWLIAGFVLFRFFDVIKPWPIGWLDKKVSGGVGIMIDDIVAGIFALIVLLIIEKSIVYIF